MSITIAVHGILVHGAKSFHIIISETPAFNRELVVTPKNDGNALLHG